MRRIDEIAEEARAAGRPVARAEEIRAEVESIQHDMLANL
jgi:hypothetical protein